MQKNWEVMMKYPIGIQHFEEVIKGGDVYVVKNDLMYRLVVNKKISILSRVWHMEQVFLYLH